MSLEYNQSRPIDSSEKEKYEGLLWAKAEEYSDIRNKLLQEQSDLDKELSEMRKKKLNLHEEQVLADKESNYWQLQKGIDAIKQMEVELQAAIEKLDANNLSLAEAENYISIDSANTETSLSKRKAAILREKERFRNELLKRGVPKEDMWVFDFEYVDQPLHSPGGPNAARVTTGRNLKRIKTGKTELDALNSEGEFYYQTADTHGGKVKSGKKGLYHVSSGGKKIRKN